MIPEPTPEDLLRDAEHDLSVLRPLAWPSDAIAAAWIRLAKHYRQIAGDLGEQVVELTLQIDRDRTTYATALKGMESQAEVGDALNHENRELVKRLAALEPLLDRLSDLLVTADDGDVDCGACGVGLVRANGTKQEHRGDCPVALAAALLRKECDVQD